MLPSSRLTMLLSLLTTTSSLVLLLLLVVRRRKKERAGVVSSCLPPGSQGYPLVGETLRMIAAYKTETPDSFIDERVRMHGRVFTSHVFGERTVFSADPEVNRLVLQSEGRLLECSYPSSISTLLGKHSLLLTKGAYHKRMHSLTLSSFSNPTVLRDLLLPDIDRLVRRNLHSWADGRVLLLLDQAKKITFELAVKQLMSCEPGEWTEGLRKEYLLLINGFFSVPVPFKLPFTTYGRALKARTKVADQIRLVVRKRILQHRQQSQAAAAEQESANSSGGSRGGGGCNNNNNNTNNIIKNRDVLDTLLSEGVTEEEVVVDFLLALLVAAYETTPTAMTLAVKFLTESPAALALLKEEHERIRDRKKRNGSDDDPFDWSEYKSAMPFTHSVINETLRVSNIISGVFRRATSDINIKGYTIPKGCKVFASFRAVHMDDDHFEDARTFNPWRWQKKRQQHVDQGGGQQEYASPMSNTNSSRSGATTFCVFGGGSRLCPGYELARVELCVFLHHLLTTFSWDAADEDKLVFFPTTRTVKGYPIRVRRRSYPN